MSFYEFLNFWIVFSSNGYLGNIHLAFNFSYGNPTLMMALRPILIRKSAKAGVSMEEYLE